MSVPIRPAMISVTWTGGTARSGRPVSKVFVEERASRVLLVLDRRPAMRFGTRREPKMASAARVAAMLLFSAIAVRESVRGILLEDTARQYPFSHSLDQSLLLLNAMSAAPAPADSRQASLAHTLQELLHSEAASTVLYVISDFHDIEPTESRLWSTLGERFDVHAIHVTDRAEERLDDTGPVRLTSPVSGQTAVINTHDPRIRKAYEAASAQRRQALANLFAASAIRYRTLYTDQDPFMTLGDWL